MIIDDLSLSVHALQVDLRAVVHQRPSSFGCNVGKGAVTIVCTFLIMRYESLSPLVPQTKKQAYATLGMVT